MTLTTQQMQRIIVEATTGQDPTLTSHEALDFRQKVEKDVKRAKEKNWTIEVPGEWEV